MQVEGFPKYPMVAHDTRLPSAGQKDVDGPALAGQRSTDNLHPNEIRQRIPGAGHAGPGSNIRSEGYELAFKIDWDLKMAE